jgi:hypothetical protein
MDFCRRALKQFRARGGGSLGKTAGKRHDSNKQREKGKPEDDKTGKKKGKKSLGEKRQQNSKKDNEKETE